MLQLIERYILESKEEWHKVRNGLFTGSRISEIIPGYKREMTKEEKSEWLKLNPKSKANLMEDPYGISDGAETYIDELVMVMEGAPRKDIQTYAMSHGIEREPFAVRAYCEKFGYDINSNQVIYTSQGGTVFYVGDNLLGATPDLIILGEKVVQFKCPESLTHLRYIKNITSENFKEKLSSYYWQMQTEMMLAEVSYGEFVSYDDRYTREAMHMKVIKVDANKEDQNFIYRKAQVCEKRKLEILNMLPK
jgi:hypothetical protein